MRDGKEALRNQMNVLEEELAAKDAEIAKLKAAAEQRDKPAPQPQKAKPPPVVEPLDPSQVRVGKPLSDGTIRYVVRPIEWVWVLFAACLGGLITGVVLYDGGGERPWIVPLVFGIFPFLFTWNAGVDVDPRTRRMRAWSGLGPIRVTRFTVASVKAPRVHSSKSDEGPGTWTGLHWNDEYLRTTLKPDQVSALVAELRQLSPGPRKSS
ncbi:MAG: hypothetical protein KF718_05850 [Polyangiaceae bacterium]|nr:hypothetical protein [Polyangiaceae bacterium]